MIEIKNLCFSYTNKKPYNLDNLKLIIYDFANDLQ